MNKIIVNTMGKGRVLPRPTKNHISKKKSCFVDHNDVVRNIYNKREGDR